MVKQNDQPRYFKRYLSTAPVLGILAVAVAFTTWVLFNAAFPDLLRHPLP